MRCTRNISATSDIQSHTPKRAGLPVSQAYSPHPGFIYTMLVFIAILFLTAAPELCLCNKNIGPSDVDNVTDVSATGYNLGDMLNMPSYYADWSPIWYRHELEGHDFGKAVIKIANRKNTILGHYYHEDFPDMGTMIPLCRYPYIPRVKASLKRRASTYIFRQHVDPYIDTSVRLNDTLSVHVRSGDRGVVSDLYISALMSLVPQFRMVVLFGRVHHDVRGGSISTHVSEYLKSWDLISEKLATVNVVTVFASQHADMDIYLMSNAMHLLVHRGGFSSLAALVCSGYVYYTDELDYVMSKPEYFHQVKHPIYVSPTGQRSEHIGSLLLDIPHLVEPSCCVFSSFGTELEKSNICYNIPEISQPGCWILAFGNPDYQFEKSVIKRTNCTMHVYICTNPLILPPDNIKEYVKIHDYCIGVENITSSKAEMHKTWLDVLRLERTKPVFVKISVNGREWMIMDEFFKYSISILQIGLRLHFTSSIDLGYPWTAGTSANFVIDKSHVHILVNNFRKNGYKLSYRQDNLANNYTDMVWINSKHSQFVIFP